MICDKCKIKTCDFCKKEIINGHVNYTMVTHNGHVNYTMVTHNRGSDEDEKKRNVCYSCEETLRNQKKVA